jgi:FixJ family two-component response regulator
MPRTVYLVDDDDAFRESARWWLESLDYHVRDFADPGVFATWLAREKPARECCMLLDIRMPQLSGLQLAERLQQEGIQIPTVYVTGHADVPLAVEAMRKGAVTFLEKPLDETALSEALALAFKPNGASSDGATPAAQEYRRRVSALTPREHEVFDFIAAGKINKIIAYELDVSIKTVELHRKRVMDKMGAASLPHLLRMAVTGEAVTEGR